MAIWERMKARMINAEMDIAIRDGNNLGGFQNL